MPRRRSKADSNLIYILLLIVFMAIFYVLFDSPTVQFRFLTEYIGVMPSLVLVVVGVYGVKRSTQGPGLLGSFIMLGLGFAYMTDQLNTLGILIPDILTPNLTLPYLQLIIVILSTVIGAFYSIS